MNLARLRLFVAVIIERLIAASAAYGQAVEKLAGKDTIITERDQTIADLKALIAALQADDAAEGVELASAIEALKAYEFPVVEEPVVEEPAPEVPTQFEEVVVEQAIADPEVGFESTDAPTVGTPEETPTDVVEAATEAMVLSFVE